MANTIKLKNSSVALKVPLTTDLVYGEVALNYADGKIYYKKSDGTIQSISGGGGGVWTKITTTTTAVAGKQYLVDTTAGAFTVTLPNTPAPVAGDYIYFMDVGNWVTNNLTIERNGYTIEGVADNIVFDLRGIMVQMVYDGSTWQIASNTGPQGIQGPAGVSPTIIGTAPVVASLAGSTTTLSMPAATTSVNGYLSSTDWTTFNNKAPTASPSFTGNVGITAGSITLAEAWQLQWGNGSTYINGTNSVIYSNAGNANVFTGTATAFTVMPSTTSSSTTSGALVVNGGAGIAGNVFVGNLTTAGVISGKISASVYQDKVTAVAASTATTVINLSLSNSFVITISASTTISFTNPPAGTDITSFTLITVNNATAGYAISWPASVTWAGGVTPARTTAANKSDVYTFFTRDAGAQYVGSLAVLNY